MAFDASALGVAAVSAAGTLASLKIIEKLLPKKTPAATTNGICHAQNCHADQVGGRLQEYHTENRKILTDIRDGIRDLVAFQKINKG